LASSPASACGDEVSPQADAFYTDVPRQPCVVMTADCLPVFFCNKDGNEVAVAHAGWKGLAAGVLEATVAKFTAPPERIIAWLGPAIGPSQFEVGAEVKAAFCDHPSVSTAQREALAAAFAPSAAGKYLADIYALAGIRLQGAGLQAIYGGGFCTVSEKDRFFSYRRDGETGRMAIGAFSPQFPAVLGRPSSQRAVPSSLSGSSPKNEPFMDGVGVVGVAFVFPHFNGG
jgi:hypothetical protein